MRNVEIKAILRDPDTVKAKAKELSGTDPEVIKQIDTFYNVPNGRLKLRRFSDGSGTLVQYDRPDMEGPKLSTYAMYSFPDTKACDAIDTILNNANGKIGVLEKIRLLYLVGQTRIHVDEVLNLGHFMELEVVLNDDQDVKIGEEISKDLMAKLGIAEEDLVPVAYIDLLFKKK